MSVTIGLAAVLFGQPASAQGNIDAGKSAAQIFSDTCAGCHRSPGQVRRATASFLRSHYTTGSDEASAMARFLANVPNEPRTPPAKKEAARPKETPAEPAAARRGEPHEQAKGQAGSAKGRRANAAEAKTSATASAAAPPEVKPPEIPAEPPAPALEPFEE